MSSASQEQQQQQQHRVDANSDADPDAGAVINGTSIAADASSVNNLRNASVISPTGSYRRSFKEKKTFYQRRAESYHVKTKFPAKIPVIVERYEKESQLPNLDKSKFLVPGEITLSQFVSIIRARMKLDPSLAFYLVVNNKSIASMSSTVGELYHEEHDEDGFLYMTYASQEMFGWQEMLSARSCVFIIAIRWLVTRHHTDTSFICAHGPICNEYQDVPVGAVVYSCCVPQVVFPVFPICDQAALN